MKIKGLGFFFCLGLMSCTHSIPKLSKEKYTDIILDLQVGETIITNSTVKNKDSLRNAIHLRICDIYGFSSIKELKASLLPLEADPELMLDITKVMSKRLDEMADSAISYPVK